MQTGSDFFFGKLQEDQFRFAQNMNVKSEGDFFKLIDAWRKKQVLPMYQDMALHKVFEDMHGKSIPKSTVSTWINRIPELLQNEDLLGELLQEKPPKKEELKLTYEEWCYMHKLEGSKLNLEYRTLMEQMENPNLSGAQLMKLTSASRRTINKINQYAMTLQDEEKQTDILSLNEDILVKGKQKILASIDALPENLSPQSIKALSGSLNESFMQNRLLQGESTDNVALGVGDIYKKILSKSQEKIGDSTQEGEIETEK